MRLNEVRCSVRNEEMLLLRNGLKQRGIKFTDHSSQSSIGTYRMERTRFTVRGHEFSVIYGTGSYGESLKLLEAILPESQEPEGDLTASEILEVVDEWRGLGNL